MRLLVIALLGLCVCFTSGCATAPMDSAADDEFDSELTEGEATSSSDSVANSTADEDLDTELDDSVVAESPAPSDDDLDVTEAPPATEAPVEATPAPEIIQEPIAQAETEAVGKTPESQLVEITNLEFKAHEGGGTVVIRTTEPTTYTTRANPENQQFVIEVANAKLPAKFKRPYNTKEFPSPFAGIQAYQKAGSTTARIVVQLREAIEPVVRQVGNSIMVSPSEESLRIAESESSGSEGEEVEETTSSALSNKNLDAFLLGQSRFYGRKISIQFRDADIRDVFNFISEESGLNIIMSEDVAGKITLKLRQVPWDQALIVIMKSKQLGYVRQGNVLRISSLGTLQKEADAAKLVMDSQTKLRPLKVKVFPVSYAKVEQLEIQSKEFISERGKVKADPRTNSLIVNDLEENIERIRKLVEILDTETPQVLIEAKIIEARQDFQRRIGLSWTLQNGNVPLGQLNTTPLSLKPGFEMSTDGKAPITAALQIGTFDLLGDIDATLNLFESEGIVRVISAPRIVTLNGVKASIEQKTQLPYKKIDQNTSSQTTTYLFKDVTLKLDVNPQITADGGVIMAVKVTREFAGADVGDGNFPINTRQADTTLLVRSGQTTVLGGIYQSDVSENESGVPFLRKLPVIGTLFRGRQTNKNKNELMIFMTPRILNKERAFRQQAKEDS